MFSGEDLSRRLEFDYVGDFVASVKCCLDVRHGSYCLGVQVAVILCCRPFLYREDTAGVDGFPGLNFLARSLVVGLDSGLQLVLMVLVTGSVGDLELVARLLQVDLSIVL